MKISSAFGMGIDGYLHGEARKFAEQAVRDGDIVSCQGPEMSNPDSNMVTLLTKSRDAKPGEAWCVWGETGLYDHPDPELTTPGDSNDKG